MDYNFFDEQIDTEYKYKILVYPNITFQQNLEKDSFIVVLSNVIKVLNKLNYKIHFTVLVPYETESLKLSNVDQVILNMPSYPNSMRTHFNYNDIIDIIDWKNNDFDIVYSHLPEHTLQLNNVFSNSTNIKPKFIGYCHWYEVKENTFYKENMFLSNIIGTLQMSECGVNSVWLKNLVLKRASAYFNDDIIQKLDKIIQPHYLGIDIINTSERKDIIPNSILFNHRNDKYTGYDWFEKEMDNLYKKRQDFIVYTTLFDMNKPYSKKVTISNRQEYLDFVRTMCVGVGCFETYSAWSISTTDGLSQGVPYILPNKLCYPEMVGNDYKFLYNSKDEFINIINSVLDDNTQINNVLSTVNLQDFLWINRVSKWFNSWNIFDLKQATKTEAYYDILNFIKEKGFVTKNDILKHRNWGVRISLSEYRNTLREEKNIIFTKNGYKYLED